MLRSYITWLASTATGVIGELVSMVTVLQPTPPPRILTAAHTVAVTFKALIEQLQATVADPGHRNREQLQVLSDDVSSCIQELLDLVQDQKGVLARGAGEWLSSC